MRYKNILFDFGGTLASLYPAKEDIFFNVLKRNKIYVNKTELIKSFFNLNYIKQSAINIRNTEDKRKFLIEYNKKILRDLSINNNPDLLAVEINEEFKEAHWRLYPDVLPVLKKLKKMGFKLAILSNWESSLHYLCSNLNINNFFELILASVDVGVEKPNLEFFRIILSRLKMNPNETIYIGDDYEQDVISAKSVGIKPFLIDKYGFYRDKDCDKIRELNDILLFLEKD